MNTGYKIEPRLKVGAPENWHRHPDEPHHCMVHDTKRIRITKALVAMRPLYTVWKRENNEWIRPHVGEADRTDFMDMVKAAEDLI